MKKKWKFSFKNIYEKCLIYLYALLRISSQGFHDVDNDVAWWRQLIIPVSILEDCNIWKYFLYSELKFYEMLTWQLQSPYLELQQMVKCSCECWIFLLFDANSEKKRQGNNIHQHRPERILKQTSMKSGPN